MASFISANPPNGRVTNKAEHQQAEAAAPTPFAQKPSASAETQGRACPETHQAKYDCNTVSAIANVRQADAAEWFNHLAYAEIGVGLATAVFAFFAALFAKHAVDAARKALLHERNRTAAELRPWVSIEINLTKFVADADSLAIHYELVFTNVGQTVASHFDFESDTLWVPQLDPETFESQFSKRTEPAEPNRFAIIPGEKKRYFGSHSTLKRTIPWTGTHTKLVSFVLTATAFYRSPMDDDWHRTDRAFTIGSNEGTATSGFFIHDTMMGDDVEMLRVRPVYSGETT